MAWEMLGITEKSPNDKKQFVDSEVISTIKKRDRNPAQTAISHLKWVTAIYHNVDEHLRLILLVSKW